ncbi:MAG: ion channel [Nakamurella sp.]
MTHPLDSPPSRRTAAKLGLFMLLRVTVTIVLLFGAYFLIPTRGDGGDSDLPWLTLELGVFAIIVAVQVPAIVKSKYPRLRAVESLAVTVPLFLLIFSRIYLSNSIANVVSFSQPLDHTTALYFTVTVFATVGFGDIVATTNGMKLLVTLQMLLNLAVLGLVIRVLTSAAERGVARKKAKGGDDSPNPNPAAS